MGATEAIPYQPHPPPPSSSSIGEESTSSQGSSSSSSDLVDDASSSLTLSPDSSSSSFACESNEGLRDKGGPLCELSDLMTHLPIKRGLSRHYLGKSQSFTSLASARSLEDLAKKETPCAKRLKLCTGRGGFEGRSSPDIRGQGSMPPRKRPSFLATSRTPIPVVRTF